jgi:hypothetical protein
MMGNLAWLILIESMKVQEHASQNRNSIPVNTEHVVRHLSTP